MVKKLYKHEYLAWLRVLPLIYGITLLIAAMLRIVLIFENDSLYYGIVFGSAVFVFVVALMVTLSSATVFGIQRFYKNLFTGEGYLTHTLPVTPANHLWVKVLTAVSFDILSVLVCLLAGVIATAGEVFGEICKAAEYLIKQIPGEYIGHAAGWTAEVIAMFVVAMFSSQMLFYLCICVGQLFRKNRVLAAVGVYFGIYAISQVVSTVLMVVFAIMGEQGVWDGILEQISQHPIAALHIVLCGSVVLTALMNLVSFGICHWIIHKKLNLE